MISDKMLKRYEVRTLEEMKSELQEATENELLMFIYLRFLRQTDYLALKLAEGLITREDKKAEFDARDFARAEINRLQSEQTKVK